MYVIGFPYNLPEKLRPYVPAKKSGQLFSHCPSITLSHRIWPTKSLTKQNYFQEGIAVFRETPRRMGIMSPYSPPRTHCSKAVRMGGMARNFSPRNSVLLPVPFQICGL